MEIGLAVFDQKRLDLIKNTFENKKVLIIGDLMLDEYLIGDVRRISPEAPVPVVDIEEQQVRFGGAANVALNIHKLGCIPILVGVLGSDRDGERFRDLMMKHGLPQTGLVSLNKRPTTVKTRIIGGMQHIARIDRESKDYLVGSEEQNLIAVVKDLIAESDGIILQDYNKGVLTESLIKITVDEANRLGKLVTVDPKFINFLKFREVSVFKPNIKETEEALAVKISNEDELISAGKMLLNKIDAKSVLITRGPEGMSLFEKSGEITHVPTRARHVADVSGAGDTVISTLTAALLGGADYREAANMANFAAGIVCEEMGIVPIDVEKLFQVCLG
jgi:D-glycero-beta-D-manno-heptose-7-phosphate kinase